MASERKITWKTLYDRKRSGRKISVLTCYDAPTARIMERAGVEVLLVGDTAAEVVLGLETTRQMVPEFLLELTSAVRRGAPDAFVMADLPYACRCTDVTTTVEWSRRFVEETGADGVKIEVTGEHVEVIAAAAGAGLPVIAHLGLLPQMIDPADGYRAQGCDAAGAVRLLDDARRMEDAGAQGLLLEAVASEVAREITTRVRVPVIGCVAGPGCDGTVVVLHDMIGHDSGHPPRKVKRYDDLAGRLADAFGRYVEDIHAGRFPATEHEIRMKPGEFEKLAGLTGGAR